MKLKESTSIAIRVSMILGFMFAAVLYFFYYFHETHLATSVLFLVLFVFISFFIIQLYIDRYIYDHIKVIYKLIHNQESKETQEEKRAPLSHTASIESVHQEVLGWSKDYEEEISES